MRSEIACIGTVLEENDDAMLTVRARAIKSQENERERTGYRHASKLTVGERTENESAKQYENWDFSLQMVLIKHEKKEKWLQR